MVEDISETYKLAASYTIGSYILPGEPMDKIQKIVDKKIQLYIIPCDDILAGVKAGDFELGLIESPLEDKELIFKEWMSDELVVCSKKPLSDNFGAEEIASCKLICRPKGTLTRDYVTSFLKKFNLSYRSFNSLVEIGNPTAMIQSIKWSKPNQKNPTVAIVSQLAIESELTYKELYQSQINNTPMKRTFHLLYNKNNIHMEYINKIIASLEDIGRK